jgi:leucyl-tRNA synthetase
VQRYNPKDIEPKWQEKWERDKLYEATENPDKPKKYVLEYFPYPSGAAMHVGHVRNYTIGDVLARIGRMHGYNVLHPMGWDAFGLPAENYAIKNNVSPRIAIEENTARFKKQLMQMGFSYDWSREIDSTDPKYYRWTQWFFLLLFKKNLAYQQQSLQWWCPFDKTVLANEQVENGRCWRCGHEVEKKSLKQWFFRITDYAERLEKDLDDVNWSESIKSMQRNWIGKSIGAEVNFAVDAADKKITVFTTRPDTLYGATFMVLSPEHPLVEVITTDEHKQHVTTYAKATQAKSEVERQETSREKTGVFTGAYALNPANGAKIPVWIADYVLFGYGTGAIMAVPAHDERDREFAQKYNLPITPVVTPAFFDQGNERLPDKTTNRIAVRVVAHDPETDRYCLLKWRTERRQGYEWPGGGVENKESLEDAAMREFTEETGFTDVSVKQIVNASTSYFINTKNEHKRQINNIVAIELNSMEHNHMVGSETYEQDAYDVVWLSRAEIEAKLASMPEETQAISRFAFEDAIHVGEGVLINSDTYDNFSTSEAREKIIADLQAKGQAVEKINYKMRDWLISRQRYWGAPIPIIHCPKDGAVPVPEDQLPVLLPEIKTFEPSGDGRSPLANVPEFVHTTCPTCGGPAERETDTMDGFACSSWYFLRFADPHNDYQPFERAKADFWLPVDDYIGGAEHAVMHLLYARFWTKVMYDDGLINFEEPFMTLRNHGMILAPDGNKMSKSKGNTIEPDSLIDQGYGADSVRIMELFIGPWNQVVSWSVDGMGGAYRFLQRVWTLTQEFADTEASGDEQPHEKALLRVAHRTIKKVSEDVSVLSFNTALAAQMEAVNELYKLKEQDHFASHQAWQFVIESMLQLLAPFAPHMSEELWQQLGHEQSIHQSSWPKYDETYLVLETMTIVVQVNGKLRAELQLPTSATEAIIIKAAETDEKLQPYLQQQTIKKTVYVPGRLVNFVI